MEAIAQVEVIELSCDRELIPEGIAIHESSGKIYLSSLYQDKIVEIDLETNSCVDLFSSGQYGYSHGVGMTIKGDLLYALSGGPTEEGTRSELLVYDLARDTVAGRYRLEDDIPNFMNDLAVSEAGEVYITDTDRHLVYKLAYPGGSIEPYFSHPSLQYPNGIAISDDDKLLFVDSWTEGIRIIDLSSGELLNEGYAGSPKYLAVDGLKYYRGGLYGIRNGDRDISAHAFAAIELAADRKEVDSLQYLVQAHPVMNIPTTFCIHEGTAYILANAQLENLDMQTQRLIAADSLQPTYIIKYPLN